MAAPVTDEWSTYEPVTAATVQPDIRNRSEVRRFLERRYQPILSRTGATGSTMLRFWIDEDGKAQRILMVGSSGNDRLDELAMSVAEVIRFKPAVLAGVPVRVVVDVPIRFQAMQGM
jgi:TonB family protein